MQAPLLGGRGARATAALLTFSLLGCGGGSGGTASPGTLPSADVPSGFVQATNAFAFPNFGGASSTSRIGPTQLPRMFTVSQVCAGAADPKSCNPTPIAGQYLDAVNKSMTGGRCEGFAVLTGLMYLGKIEPTQFGASSAHDLKLLNNPGLGQEIAYWYSTQYLKEVIKTSTKMLGATDAVKMLAAEYAKPGHDLYRVGLVRLENGVRKGGHAVLATGVGPGSAPNQYVIKVYDNNHPEAERTIAVDAKANSWQYQASTNPSDAASLYSGDAKNGNQLYLSAITPRLGMHDCPFCSGDATQDMMALNQIFGFGNAEVTVTDESGKSTGESGGKVTTGIPGTVVTPAFTDDLWTDRAPLMMLVPGGKKLDITLKGTPGTETSSLSWFAKGTMVALEGASVAMGETEKISIDATGTKVTYQPSAGAPAVFVTGHEGPNGVQTVVRVQVPEATAAGASLTITIDPTTGDATLKPTGMGAVMLPVEVQKGSVSGSATFGADVPVSAGGSSTLLVQAWAGGDAPLGAASDSDGDGTPEQTTMLIDVKKEPPKSCANTVLSCGHGTCTDDGVAPACKCDTGWGGAACDMTALAVDCSKAPCRNGGTCTDGAGTFTCQCPAGFSGLTCETNVDDCMPNPCKNGGTCTDQVNGFSCQCAAGFTGVTCESSCEPGAKKCMDAGFVTCGADGKWGATVTACANQACVAGACTGVCAPGAKQCGDKGLETCDASGQWSMGVACLNQACVAGACAGVCKPGVERCAGNGPEVCDETGQWTASQTCSCVGTECVATMCDFPAKSAGSVGASPYWVLAVDLNGDGKPDLASADLGANQVSVLLNQGAGVFAAAVAYPVGAAPLWLTAGDFDANGKTDLVAANTNSNNVTLLLGKGDGTFAAGVPIAACSRPRAVTTGDFNGDFNADLVVACEGDNGVVFMAGDGTGSFGAPAPFAAGTQPNAIVARDLNSDAKLDLIVSSWGLPATETQMSMSVLLGNGAGSFAPAVAYAAGSRPNGVDAGDVDGDGDVDVVVANGGGTLSVFKGDGTGSLSAPLTLTRPAVNFRSVVIADLNGDGRPDLTAASEGGNAAVTFYGDGHGAFSASVAYAADTGSGAAPVSVAARDMDGDGRVDLLLSCFGSGRVTMLTSGGCH